jgi:hypothetical protein
MYIYQTPDFRADEKGITLLRNKYAYKTIAYHDLLEASVQTGPVLKNPVAAFLMGVLLLGAGLCTWFTYNPFNAYPGDLLTYRGGKALAYVVMFTLGFIFFGAYIVYQSQKKDFLLFIRAKGVKESLPLTAIREVGYLQEFITDLQTRTGQKLEVPA